MNLRAAIGWIGRVVPPGRGAALLLLMMLASLTEGCGLLLLVPLLEWLGRPGGGASASWLRELAWLGWQQPAVGPLLGAFVALVALRAAIQYGRDQTSARLQLSIVDGLRSACFEALLRAEWRWTATTRRADHVNVLLSEVGRVAVGLNFGLLLIASSATLSTYLAAAMFLSWRLTVVALASAGVLFLLLAGQRRTALGLGQQLTQAGRVLHGLVQDGLAGVKLAKIHGAEARQIGAFADAGAEIRQRQLQFAASTGLSQALFQVGGAALLAGYLYLGLQWWRIPVPVLLTLVVIFSRLVPVLLGMQQQVHHALQALPAAREIDRLLAEGRRQAEPTSTGPHARWPVRDAIRLDALRIVHPGRVQPALDGLSLRLPAGQVTVMTGPSGAGKSTLADVLMGLLVPDAGRLAVDDREITGADRLAWRAQVAYVPQDAILFHDSIRRNLLWACPEASEDEMHRALARASAQFVRSLPQGLDTVVGEGGVRMSGGERQRVALARALLREPSLLILDEATSALDVANESHILDALERLRGQVTVLVIGHRPSLVRHADQVLVLEDGQLQSASRGGAAPHRPRTDA